MLICLYLLWGTWQDLQNKKIKNSYLWVGGIVGIILKMTNVILGRYNFKDWIWALLPGILLLVIARVTKEKIGMGDGWVLLILGNYLSIVEIWYVFQIALLTVTIFSLILLCIKKINKEYEIPFLPFLWAAYTFLWRMHYV